MTDFKSRMQQSLKLGDYQKRLRLFAGELLDIADSFPGQPIQRSIYEALRRHWSLFDEPRVIDEKERAAWGVDGGIVTADSPADRSDYNCHGFAVGVRAVLIPPIDGPTFMESMGYNEHKGPHSALLDMGGVVALFYKEGSDPWHTAKRLRGESLPPDLYESKFGFWPEGARPLPGPPVGFRIVHRLGAIRQRYGDAVSYWVRDCSQDGDSKRRTALERDHNLREGDYDTVEDSAEILSSRMDLLRLLP